MKIERIFNNESTITLESILKSILNEKVDTLISKSYANNKVNSTDSATEGELVA
ncbi:hypothetical protein [Niallia sp. 03133]|uniref:hypothetical protein n=1 Tax=Niallia sp. 03133 TaxID=3458060 RepID=UPI00404506A4